ncbi:MAG: hypothetical protein CMD36_07855 [Flavobacteriales bacterium]|nr:hypothetical protein [Flavobacteriales bacterium]
MKHLILILLFPTSVFSQILWDNFEDTRIGYYEFVHGGMTTRFENPDLSSSVNSSTLCAQYVRNPGETYDVIVIVANGSFLNLENYLDGTKKMKVDVYSPAVGIPLQITLEDSSVAGATNYPDGRHSIYTAVTTVANEWETIEFTFDSRPDNSVSDVNVTSLILLFDIGNNTNDTYYFDNLYGPEFNNQCDGLSIDPTVNFADWDCNWNLGVCPSASACGSFDYVSGWLNQVYNPDNTTINTSKYSGEYTRNPDSNGEDVLISYFTSGNLDLSSNKFFNFKVYGPPRPLYISFQDDNNNEVLGYASALSSNNQWQQFTVDLSSVATQSIGRFVLFLDQSIVNWDTYHLDDFHLSSTPLDHNFINYETNINIYPQPTNNTLNIQSDNNIKEILIYDCLGKEISHYQKFNKSSRVKLDVSNLVSGTYFIKIQTKDNTTVKQIQIAH